MFHKNRFIFILSNYIAYISLIIYSASSSAFCPSNFPESPNISTHLEIDDILSGKFSVYDLYDHGRQLFSVQPNGCDGLGRPATTGTGEKREPNQPEFIRTSGPDSNSCGGCHNQPTIGGSGDFVSNVFVLAQAQDPVIETISSEFSNERNTLGMYGSGVIEMLALEMTEELHEQLSHLDDGYHVLTTKGVDFEILIKNNEVVWSNGVDTDLIIKPFHQSGVVVSLREFSVNAMNHHHGIQPEERFDLNPSKGFDSDFDEDGIHRELTLGDITAITIFQALLPIPQQIKPKTKKEFKSIKEGERLFRRIGCNDCHIPSMILENTLYSDVNPYNPKGTFNDKTRSITVDLLKDGPSPRLKRNRNNEVVVRAYTDLKRHNLCDDESVTDSIRYYCNEYLDQGRPSHDGNPGANYFLTRKLWDAGSSAPYGHRGDLSTLSEAILFHGGEGRRSRDNFVNLSTLQQKKIISFLKSLKAPDNINYKPSRFPIFRN